MAISPSLAALCIAMKTPLTWDRACCITAFIPLTPPDSLCPNYPSSPDSHDFMLGSLPLNSSRLHVRFPSPWPSSIPLPGIRCGKENGGRGSLHLSRSERGVGGELPSHGNGVRECRGAGCRRRLSLFSNPLPGIRRGKENPKLTRNTV